MLNMSEQLCNLEMRTGKQHLIHYFSDLEKSKPRLTSRSKAQYSSKKNSRREDEETDAERRILEKARRGGTLEDGNEVMHSVSWMNVTKLLSDCLKLNSI